MLPLLEVGGETLSVVQAGYTLFCFLSRQGMRGKVLVTFVKHPVLVTGVEGWLMGHEMFESYIFVEINAFLSSWGKDCHKIVDSH